MYYSMPQLELLRVLRIVGCLERRQAYTLLQLCYGISPLVYGRLIRQLQYGGKLRISGDGRQIISPYGRSEPHLSCAIDIALSFAGPENAPKILPCRKDFLLCVSFAAKGLHLWIIHVPEGCEQEKSTLLDRAQETEPEQSVYVMLLDNAAQAAHITAASPCLLAYPDANGRTQLVEKEVDSHGFQ